MQSWFGRFRSIFNGNLSQCCNSCAAHREAEMLRTKKGLFFKWSMHNIQKFTNHPSIRKTVETINEKLDILGEIFLLNCNAVVAQRIRRSTQIMNLYSKIYNECSVRYFMSRFGQRIMQNSKGHRVQLLFGATLFSWAQERVTEEEMEECMAEVLPSSTSEEVEMDQPQTSSNLLDCVSHHVAGEGWEKIIDRANLQTWRKPLPGASHLYEYKVCGTFYDIPARAFFAVQVDLAYRKKWDRLVIALDSVDRDTEEENSEVVRWVTHYPYPMYSREYVYVRRYMVDTENNVMVLVSRAVDHPDYPVTDNYVRVHSYNSSMVIRPHTGFDDNGLDYVLTYHDDPQAAFPTLAYNWMATTGVPDFVEKLHVAARNLMTTNRKQRPVYTADQSGDTVACYS